MVETEVHSSAIASGQSFGQSPPNCPSSAGENRPRWSLGCVRGETLVVHEQMWTSLPLPFYLGFPSGHPESSGVCLSCHQLLLGAYDKQEMLSRYLCGE